jgi:hypothetical protein
MTKTIALALALTLGCTTFALAKDDDDKIPEADMARVTAALADLGCKDPEGVKHEQEGIYEIDDAKCKMGTMDIKLDKDFSVILISRYKRHTTFHHGRVGTCRLAFLSRRTPLAQPRNTSGKIATAPLPTDGSLR